MGGEFYLRLESYRIGDAIEIKKGNSLNELVTINTSFSNITDHALKVMNTCIKWLQNCCWSETSATELQGKSPLAETALQECKDEPHVIVAICQGDSPVM